VRARAHLKPRRQGRLRVVAPVIAGVLILPLARAVPFSGAAVASATVGAAQSFGAANTSASTNLTATTPPNAPHIMVIVMENKAYNKSVGSAYIIGSSKAPYINSLATKYRSATLWYGVQHPSPGDYLELISGSNQNLGSGGKRPFTAPTLVDKLSTANIRWKAYMESMPNTPCYAGGTTGLYEGDHNPFVYFKDYKSLCDSKGDGVFTYTLSRISTDLNSSTPPDFVWVTPNICDDMHTNGGSCGPTGVSNGDTWLKNNLPTVLSSPWYASGGVVIITWDESVGTDKTGISGQASGEHVATVVISAHNQGAGNFVSIGDHYGTLRGIEESYGVVPLLGGSANIANGDLKNAF
jgi:hypothetical protein